MCTACYNLTMNRQNGHFIIVSLEHYRCLEGGGCMGERIIQQRSQLHQQYNNRSYEIMLLNSNRVYIASAACTTNFPQCSALGLTSLSWQNLSKGFSLFTILGIESKLAVHNRLIRKAARKYLKECPTNG